MVDNILYQTTLYANQRERNFPPFKREEFYGFLGINMLMGYHELPSLSHYWKVDQDLSVPIVSSTMPRNRFAQILSNLHMADNTAVPNDNKDKLYKVRPLITAMNVNYVKLYNISQKLSIDESMILFKGRHSIKQYCPMKPVKRGYKLWMRADMDGYISKFDVYQGKDSVSEESENDEGTDGFGLGEKVVSTLVNDLHDKHHQVYFDNYFSSIPLMEYLKSKGVHACGTIRSNRRALPVGIKPDKSLERGEFDHRVSKEGILYVKWNDNKPVHVVSNFHGTDTTEILRTQKDGTRKKFPSPTAVKSYSQHMGGVDKADMLCSIYGLNRKAKKWWHRLFFGIIDRTVVNAMIAYNKLQNTKTNTLHFRRQVALSLITLSHKPKIGRPLRTPPLLAKKRRQSKYSVSRAVRLENRGAHWVVYGEKRGRCEVCSQKKVESRPHSQCSMCKVFLCSNANKNCFNEYHEFEQ